MKQIIILLLITFNYSYSLAQNAGSSNFQIGSVMLGKTIKSALGGSKGNTYKGSPYHTPNYLIGSIYKEGKLLSNNVALRYNISADEIEVKESMESPDSEAQMLLKSLDIFVQINGDLFYYMSENNPAGKAGYFQLLAEGPSINLYKKVVKEFIAEEKPTPSSPRGKFAYFKDKTVYYFVDKEGKFYEISTSKKKILKILNGDTARLNKFIKKNKINFKKEKDLKKFINFFNSI